MGMVAEMPAETRRRGAPSLPLEGGNDILPFTPAFAAGLAVAIFVVDTFTPFDVAIAVLYVAVVLLSLNFASRRGLMLIAAGCLVLTVLAFFLAHGLDAPIGSVARLGVSLTAIVITAALALRVRESIDVLRDSERRYRNIFLASGIAILEMDFTALGPALSSGEVPAPREALTRMRLRNANATAIKMFGTADFESFARALPSFTPHEMEPVIAAMLAAIAAGERYYEAEMVMTTMDGRRIDVLTTLALPADRPEMDLALVTIMDVTARRDAERRLGETRSQLAHINRVATMGELTASIAHEVNQPLAAIVTNGQAGLRWLTRAQPDIAESQKALTRIVADAERASDVIKHLRSLSMRGTPEAVPVDVNRMIGEALELVEPELRSRQAMVRFEPASGLPSISGDPVQLQQVIINLVMNSAQAMTAAASPERIIAIATRRDGSAVRITVEDTGPGLPHGDSERLFEAFYTTRSDGVGMGLSICRTILEAHGGSISAGARSGGGARFTITLPSMETG